MPVASSTPRFLQGIYAFEGQGLKNPVLLDPSLVYTVPTTPGGERKRDL